MQIDSSALYSSIVILFLPVIGFLFLVLLRIHEKEEKKVIRFLYNVSEILIVIGVSYFLVTTVIAVGVATFLMLAAISFVLWFIVLVILLDVDRFVHQLIEFGTKFTEIVVKPFEDAREARQNPMIRKDFVLYYGTFILFVVLGLSGQPFVMAVPTAYMLAATLRFISIEWKG